MFQELQTKHFILFLVDNICDIFPELNCSYGCLFERNGNSHEGYCFCASGYRLHIDNSTCKGMIMKFYINLFEYTQIYKYIAEKSGISRLTTILYRDTHISINFKLLPLKTLCTGNVLFCSTVYI